MALLEVRDVTKKFGELVANDRVSFTVEAGTIVGLIGPNGAGKTTLFNCISGLYPATAGRIFFDGADITGLPSYRIARLGAVRTFQVVRPLKDMTVFDNVLVGAFLQGAGSAQARETAEDCIALCSLERVRGQTRRRPADRRQEAPRAGAGPGNAAQAADARRGHGGADLHRGQGRGGADPATPRKRHHAADRRARHGGHHAHRRQGRGARRRRQDRRGRPRIRSSTTSA